jgi:hypothetical protein
MFIYGILSVTCGWSIVFIGESLVTDKLPLDEDNRSVASYWQTSPDKHNRTAASYWQTWSHNVTSSTPCLTGIRTHNSGNRHWLTVGLKGHNLLKLKPELSGWIKGNFEMTKNNFLVVLCYGCVVFVMVVIFCQSVPITTVVSSNPGQTRCTRCNIMCGAKC